MSIFDEILRQVFLHAKQPLLDQLELSLQKFTHPFQMDILRALLGMEHSLDPLDTDAIYVIAGDLIRYHIPCTKPEAGIEVWYLLGKVELASVSPVTLKYHAHALSYRLSLK